MGKYNSKWNEMLKVVILPEHCHSLDSGSQGFNLMPVCGVLNKDKHVCNTYVLVLVLYSPVYFDPVFGTLRVGLTVFFVLRRMNCRITETCSLRLIPPTLIKRDTITNVFNQCFMECW